MHGHAVFNTGIGDLDISFTVAILENLYCHKLPGHDFLVENEVFWDCAAATIHLGTNRRTKRAEWSRISLKILPDLSQLEIQGGPNTHAKLNDVYKYIYI